MNMNINIKNQFYASPFDQVYKSSPFEVDQSDFIQEIWQYAWDTAETYPGDIDLEAASNQLRYNRYGFVLEGLDIAKIKFVKAWKSKYSSFRDYCKSLGKHYTYYNRLIQAAHVVMELISFGFRILPSNEYQCRLISEYRGSELYRIWKDITEIYPEHQINATTISQYLGRTKEPAEEPEYATLKLDFELYCVLVLLAHWCGLTPSRYLYSLLMPENDANCLLIDNLIYWRTHQQLPPKPK